MFKIIDLFIALIETSLRLNWSGAGVRTRGGRFARDQGARIGGR